MVTQFQMILSLNFLLNVDIDISFGTMLKHDFKTTHCPPTLRPWHHPEFLW